MVSEMFPGEDMILNRINEMGWEDVYIFQKIIAAGNGIISILPEGVTPAGRDFADAKGIPGYERWQIHQRWNREMHAARASKLRIPMVLGFFRAGEAEEMSLFESSRFSSPYPYQAYVIGRGCADMAHDMWADWDTNEDHQFDEDFSMGGEEYYRANSREYTRESATGRHHYRLTIGPDNRVVNIETKGFEKCDIS